MSNLFKSNKDKIEQAKSNQSMSIKERLTQIKVSRSNILLIDISGSMGEYVGDNKTKYEHVRDILKKLPSEITTYGFNDVCEKFENSALPEPCGGTNMAWAFFRMKNNKHSEIILITDGEPNSEKDALNAAKELNKIDIIYIGPEPMPDFLKKLAKATNGNFTNVDMLATGAGLQLENKIKGLLK